MKMKQSKVLLVEPNNNTYGEEALEKPLGGSETIFIFLVRALRNREDIDLDVFFRDSGDYSEFVKGKNYDLVISYRSPEPLFNVRGKINSLYLQDLPNPQSIALMNILFQQGKLNKMIFLSHFQKIEYLKQMPNVDEGRHCLMLENGLDLSLFDSSIEKKNEFIYASAPNRGLDVLLKMWPKIHEELPEYTLKLAGSTTMYNVQSNEDELNKPREVMLSIGKKLYKKAKSMNGVKLLGGLSHAELISELEKSKALLYPSTFPETCCHVLNCALHAGATPMISGLGAIVEKVGNGENGIIIGGDTNSKEFREAYVKSVIYAIQSSAIDRMIKTNRGAYMAWGMDRLVERLVSQLIKIYEHDGINQRIFGVVCSLHDRKEARKVNFRNLVWYSPIDMMTEEITGLPLDQARNAAASMAIINESDWLLFLDADVFVDKFFVMDMMDKAEEHHADVIVANYAYISERLVPAARVVRVSDNRAINCYGIQEEDLNDPEKYHIATAGLGATLISTRALEKIGRPYFRTQNIQFKQTGEDSYFYQECRSCGIKVYLTTDIPTVHVGPDGTLFGVKEHKNKIGAQIGNIPDELKPLIPKQQMSSGIPDMYYTAKDYYSKVKKPSMEGLINMDSRYYNVKKECEEFVGKGKVLDAGCGDGSLSGQLGDEFKVTKMDLIGGDGIVLEHDMDTMPYPFKDEQFDGVICSEVLEHLFNPQIAIAEMHRVLKSGGILLLTVPNFDSIDNVLGKGFMGLFNPTSDMSVEHIRHYNLQVLLNLTKTKFELLKVIGNSPHMNSFFASARKELLKHLKEDTTDANEKYPNEQIHVDRVLGECFPTSCMGILLVLKKK